MQHSQEGKRPNPVNTPYIVKKVEPLLLPTLQYWNEGVKKQIQEYEDQKKNKFKRTFNFEKTLKEQNELRKEKMRGYISHLYHFRPPAEKLEETRFSPKIQKVKTNTIASKYLNEVVARSKSVEPKEIDSPKSPSSPKLYKMSKLRKV